MRKEDAMKQNKFKYVIVGGGLAGDSAITGIREIDKEGTILLVGKENHLPYDRPPLSKKLWFGKKKIEDIYLHDEKFYIDNGVELRLGCEILKLKPDIKQLLDSHGETISYDKLLLATGGGPRKLDIPGSDAPGLFYYRYIDDYLKMRQEATQESSVLIIGGGFIGTEMAAAMNFNKLKVSIVFPSQLIAPRVFPKELASAIQQNFIERGINIIAEDIPIGIEEKDNGYMTYTKNGRKIFSDIITVGIGISPSVDLAKKAHLAVDNGVVVNTFLQTSNLDIYAAGDNTSFPYEALGVRTRIEHWDNALNQGKQAGRNMAGTHDSYTYMPYFFSDIFDFGYEAVGDVNTTLMTFAEWEKKNESGVIYYTKDNSIRGALMCNNWGKVDVMRQMILDHKEVPKDSLHYN